ncbi:GIY-YIG nuclease family protein [Microvirga rosea]|uniref:hypothetical protein n=1 Tax=Microvirga rosea TaxID=2715425 RepID=UPI001D0A3EF5|nr:hypothetical protein [Microvirga rosea]MCB8821922.1 hypothetical protein [Microvirga rosea]
MSLEPLPLPRVEISYPIEDTSLAVFTSKITKATVVRSAWDDLRRLLQLPELQGAIAYLLVGVDEKGRLCARVGEAGKPVCRLPDHRRNEDLNFAEEIFVLTNTDFDKSDIIYLQERISGLLAGTSSVHLVKGTGPILQPLCAPRRLELDLVLRYGLTLLKAAGCPWLRPTRRSAGTEAMLA